MTKNKWHSLLAATLTLLMLWVFIPQAQATMSTNSYSTQYTKSTYYTKLKNVTITGNQRDDIVNIALSQVGYHEGNNNNQLDGSNIYGSDNYTEYNYWYYSGTQNGGDAAPWCAVFVSWCARQAGIGTDIIKNSNFSSCNSFNIKSYASNAYTPKKGDLFFIKTDHVGIVTGVDSNYVYTVEGNCGDAVKKNSRLRSEITTYGVPNYNYIPYPEPPYGTILDTSSPQCDYVRWLQWKLNDKGYNCDTIDGWYGDNTKSAVERFQNEHRLNVTGVFNDGTHAMLVNPYPVPPLTMEFSIGSQGDYVCWIQWQLNNVCGFNCGAIDGYYGNNTANAIKSFQNSCGLTADGIAGHDTLYSLINEPIPQPIPQSIGYYTICTVFAEMHESPSSSSVLQARISEGATLRVKSISNGWGKVTYNSQDGWIPLSNCIFDGSINRTYTVIAPNNPKNTIPLRTAPNSSATIKYNILDGSLLHVDYFYNGWGRTTYKEGDYWINLCYCKYNSSMSRYYTISISSASELNMYMDHSSSSAVRDQIPNGATLRVKSFYNGWGQVKYNGNEGWILLSKCKYNSSINRTYTVITPGSSLELRTAPNSSAAIVFRVPDGALLHVDYFYNGWGRTTYNGEQCWVNLCYCKYNSGMNRNYTVLANPLTMYAGNSTSTNVKTTIPCGTVIRVTAFKNGWGQTTYNGETGWVDLHLCSYNP